MTMMMMMMMMMMMIMMMMIMIIISIISSIISSIVFDDFDDHVVNDGDLLIQPTVSCYMFVLLVSQL